jgi:hypothetical protein
LISTGFGFARRLMARKPPRRIPATKKRFQISFVHSYLKKGILAGKQAAHIWRKEEEMPKALFPIINSTGTVNPISGPATYHGQGFLRSSNIYELLFLERSRIII